MTRLVDLSPAAKVISCPLLKNDGLNILYILGHFEKGEDSMVSTVFYLLKAPLPASNWLLLFYASQGN